MSRRLSGSLFYNSFDYHYLNILMVPLSFRWHNSDNRIGSPNKPITPNSFKPTAILTSVTIGCSPWEHDASCPQHRQNIKDSDTGGDQYRMLDLNDTKSDRQLKKRQRHDNDIRPDTHKQSSDHILSDLQEQGCTLLTHLSDNEIRQLIKIHSNEERKNHHQNQLDKQRRNRCGQSGHCRHCFAGNGGNHLAQILYYLV